ncbi:MAG: hypothetical protein RBR93_08690 [Aliarcobacter butzleri]|nr:hypothetical protein [Aliarcobacter butzleri]
MLDAKDKQSNEYKEGWNNAICYLNDNYCITKRNGEAIQISFEVLLTNETKVTQGLENWKQKQKKKIKALMKKFLAKQKSKKD